MNYRIAKILARKNFIADAIEPLAINIKDPISQIILVNEVLGVGGVDLLAHRAAHITKIEIFDGSDVSYSLSGVEAQAVDFYHNKREPANTLTYVNTHYAYEVYKLNFGRYLYDPLLAWDPKKFVNPQMKITIDLNASEALVASGYLTVMAHIFDEKEIVPEGFLMHKEIKSWDLAADAHEYTDLPTDFPYRKLFLRAQRYDFKPTVQVDQIKISEDNDKRIPVDNTSEEVLKAIQSSTPPYREALTYPGYVAARFVYVTPTYRALYGAAPWRNVQTEMNTSVGFGDGGRIAHVETASGPNIQIFGEGYLPHGVFEIPFGLQNEPDDWYDVGKVGSLKADITGGESTGSAELMLQQFRKY
ncbi:hypothetical protein ES702_05084 [subsurface metagenome]